MGSSVSCCKVRAGGDKLRSRGGERDLSGFRPCAADARRREALCSRGILQQRNGSDSDLTYGWIYMRLRVRPEMKRAARRQKDRAGHPLDRPARLVIVQGQGRACTLDGNTAVGQGRPPPGQTCMTGNCTGASTLDGNTALEAYSIRGIALEAIPHSD